MTLERGFSALTINFAFFELMWVGGGGGGDIPSCQHSFLSALLSPEPVGGF